MDSRAGPPPGGIELDEAGAGAGAYAAPDVDAAPPAAVHDDRQAVGPEGRLGLPAAEAQAGLERS